MVKVSWPGPFQLRMGQTFPNFPNFVSSAWLKKLILLSIFFLSGINKPSNCNWLLTDGLLVSLVRNYCFGFFRLHARAPRELVEGALLMNLLRGSMRIYQKGVKTLKISRTYTVTAKICLKNSFSGFSPLLGVLFGYFSDPPRGPERVGRSISSESL